MNNKPASARHFIQLCRSDQLSNGCRPRVELGEVEKAGWYGYGT